jgi:hypothetical protein
MTLQKQDIKKLSELTKIPVKTLTTAIESEEETPLEFNDDLQVFDSEELEVRDKETAKKAGNTAIEMAVKEARNDNELDFQGKTIPNLVTAIIAKTKKAALEEAGKKPNETIEQQKQQIETLQSNIEKLEKDKDEEIKQLKTEKQKVLNNMSVSSKIPDGLNTAYTNRDLTNLFNIEHEVKIDDDGNRTWYRDGKPLLDKKTQKPEELDDIISGWLDGKGIKAESNPQGRGAGDNKGKKDKTEISKIKTSEDFYTYLKENDIPHEKRKEILAKIREENPEFVLGES